MSKSSREVPSPERAEGQRRVRPTERTAVAATVFLLDGDEAVRDAVATSLRGAGFTVECFGSAQQFLDAYRPGHGGCLVVDVDLAGVESELLRMLELREPALPAIITSRRLRPRRSLALRLSALQAVWLEKPFGSDDLLPLIRAAIDQAGGPTDRGSGIPPK